MEKQAYVVPLVLSREHLAEHHGVLLHALLTNWQKQRDGGVRAKPSRGQELQHARSGAHTGENGRGRRRAPSDPPGEESLNRQYPPPVLMFIRVYDRTWLAHPR